MRSGGNESFTSEGIRSMIEKVLRGVLFCGGFFIWRDCWHRKAEFVRGGKYKKVRCFPREVCFVRRPLTSFYCSNDACGSRTLSRWSDFFSAPSNCVVSSKRRLPLENCIASSKRCPPRKLRSLARTPLAVPELHCHVPAKTNTREVQRSFLEKLCLPPLNFVSIVQMQFSVVKYRCQTRTLRFPQGNARRQNSTLSFNLLMCRLPPAFFQLEFRIFSSILTP